MLVLNVSESGLVELCIVIVILFEFSMVVEDF